MTDLSLKQICNFQVGNQQPLFLIAGPCVIESESFNLKVAEQLKEISENLSTPIIYKSSFDKANRTSVDSFRGVGLTKGLKILAKIKEEINIPILTDVHEDTPMDEVADIVDVMQTPAFLVRQTNFIIKVCRQGIPVNIKKGQFQAPWDMKQVVAKAQSTGNKNIMVCDRGTSFGYNTLISDMRGLVIMRESNCPVIFDATHSVQQPGGKGSSSGGERNMVSVLARAATAVGIAGLFIETHPDPDNAPCDGPNMLKLRDLSELLKQLQQLDNIVKSSQ